MSKSGRALDRSLVDAAVWQPERLDFAAAPVDAEAPVAQEDDFSTAATPLTNPRVDAPAGSIDALFGNKSANRTEDSAAAALAQAFGGTTEEAPILSGRPAHAARGH